MDITSSALAIACTIIHFCLFWIEAASTGVESSLLDREVSRRREYGLSIPFEKQEYKYFACEFAAAWHFSRPGVVFGHHGRLGVRPE